jgi:DNA mismatch endonuclease (patch repair protein)
MSDIFNSQKRKEVMSNIKSKDTKFEILVRKELFKHGFRFRKNDKRYPGKPDIFLPKYKTAIFINGCFWHRHENCKYAYKPKTNVEFWENKINGTKKRDKAVKKKLEEMRINVLIVWECELKKDFNSCIKKIISYLENILAK